MRVVLSPSRPAGETTLGPHTGQGSKRALRAPGWLIALLALIGVLLLGVPAAGLAYGLAFANRILPGVHALALDLGGLTEAEAQARLVPAIERLIEQRPVLHVSGVDGGGPQELAIPAAAFGDAETMAAGLAAAARRAGRETPLATFSAAWRAATGHGVVVELPALELTPLRDVLGNLAAELDLPAREPHLALDRSDPQAVDVRLEPAQPGRRLDVERVAADLSAAFASQALATAPGGQPPSPAVVVATLIEVPPATDAARLEGTRQRLAAAFRRPLSIAVGERTLTLDQPGQLVEGIDLAPGAGGAAEPRLTLDGAAFEALLARVTAATPAPRNARLEVKGEQVVLTPEAPGEAVDVEAMRQALTTAISSGSGHLTVPLQPVPATVTAPQLAPYLAEANRLIAEPVVITRGERSWTVGRAQLAAWLVLPAEPAAGAVGLSEERIRATLQAMARESDRPATNASIGVADGEVRVTAEEAGEALDLTATSAAVQTAMRTPGSERAVAALVRPTPADVTAAKLEPAREQAVRLTAGAITLRQGQRSWVVSQTELVEMLLFGDPSVAGTPPYLSRNKLMERLKPVADEANGVLESEFQQALKAWEARRAERQATERAEPPAEERAPQRQWVDLPATAGALWSQVSSNGPRTVDLRLTTADPGTTGGESSGDGAQAAGRGKWIDVNVTTQSLVAYEGDWPVLTARVSTGLPRTPTPIGTFRVFSKLVADDMRGGSYATGDYYFLPKVPYVMYFLEGGYALHGTFWHSNFGQPMSHGCVNLPTEQAKWLFEWAPMGTTVVVHR
ncbi:MAG TPA: peptidoglycan binding domain-containing protein [Chloroflexota bacterium]|nr:peptidoglycan binding domain-containing protein [Chloroflexota bacterium]